MGRFLINGGKPLYGTLTVSGSKNAGLPVIFASLLSKGRSEIYNLSNIGDIDVALSIIQSLGAEVTREGNRTVINAENIIYRRPPDELVSGIRASTYLIGASLSRLGRVELQSYGGCSFSDRPIDLHIASALSFGARLVDNTLVCQRLHSARIELKKASVGATVNTLIMAASADGESRIRGYAKEPHILTLIEYLKSMGVGIREEDDELCVIGSDSLTGGSVRIPGDMIEAGSYLALSLITGGRVRVVGADERELYSFTEPFVSSGVKLDISSLGASFYGTPEKKIEITTAPYPLYPTDLQPIAAPVMAVFSGGRLTEGVWQGRFGYLGELSKFGLNSIRRDNTASVFPSRLMPAACTATDLRGGFASLMCALYTDGISTVDNAEVILRGYENPIEKLSRLGAEIEYNNK